MYCEIIFLPFLFFSCETVIFWLQKQRSKVLTLRVNRKTPQFTVVFKKERMVPKKKKSSTIKDRQNEKKKTEKFEFDSLPASFLKKGTLDPLLRSPARNW